MIADQIRTLLTEEVGRDVDFTVERPNQPEHGDFATNAALVAAKQQGENPRALADTLVIKLAEHELFETVEVAGPGFINFRLNQHVWHDQLEDILKHGKKFGAFPSTKQKVQVEFISANPTGPLTLANGRGGFGGDVLARVLARVGHQVEREYYLNDAGYQVEQLGASLKGTAEDGYSGPYVDGLKKQVDTAQPEREVGLAAARILTEQIKQSVARMGISFDRWYSEQQELHETGEVAKTLADLAKAGATYEKDGALWLKTTEFGDDKDRVLRKSDGELTYLAADAAHYYHALVKQKLDLRINILGADHHGYVARLQAAVEWLRKAESFKGESVILITQLVRLVEGGKEVKMSKRAGTYVALDDLLDQIPIDVARFFFVMKSFDTHMDFDLDLAKEQSQKNPVYYLQYAHARVCSILKKAGPSRKVETSLLIEPAELTLIRELSEFPAAIAQTAADYQVHRIAHYALGVADAFHKFYEQHQVITDDEDLTAARLELVKGVQVVLQNLGDTLGIGLPETM